MIDIMVLEYYSIDWLLHCAKSFRIDHMHCGDEHFMMMTRYALDKFIDKTNYGYSFVIKQKVFYEPDSDGNLIKKQIIDKPIKFCGFDVIIGNTREHSMILGCYACGESVITTTNRLKVSSSEELQK